MTMIDPLDPFAVSELCQRIEAVHHQRGWDRPARALVVYDADCAQTVAAYRDFRANGEPVRRGRYAAVPWVAVAGLGRQPVHGLFRLAFNMGTMGDHPTMRGVLTLLNQPGLVGFGFINESWSLFGSADQELASLGDAARADPTPFADRPGAVETRDVWCVDRTGYVHLVQRARGGEQRHATHPVADEAYSSGTIKDALRAILARVLGEQSPVPLAPPRGWNIFDEVAAGRVLFRKRADGPHD